jgi:hypothetical protein
MGFAPSRVACFAVICAESPRDAFESPATNLNGDLANRVCLF